MKKVYIRTWGCQMNEYDSELIHSILSKEKFTFIEDEGDANIVLLNTCSVRDNANRKVFGYIGSIHHNRKNKQPALIGVLGCMATDLKDKLLNNKNLKIDFIAGPDSYRRLPDIINNAIKKRDDVSDIDLSKLETYSGIDPLRNKGANAWISVMRGCDNFCTFCIVPYVRGRERSRSPEEIIEEAKKAANNGFKQVTLLGQNVNSYKSDGKDFSDLLNEISKIDGIKRIRFMSPHPKDFPDKLIEIVANNEKVCNHIHLPLQAGNDRILKLMNRKYAQKDYLELVRKIRKLSCDIALTTDIIVGFPTETEDEFKDTRKVMEEVGFDSAFIFKYSPREGTTAAKKFKDDVSGEDKTKRIVELNELQKQISLRKNRQQIDSIKEILIESESTQKSTSDFQGRTDTNKIVIFPKVPYSIGDFISVKITGATANVLKGCVINVNQDQKAHA